MNLLFQPLNVKNVAIPNRIVMPAMGTNFGDGFGNVTYRHLGYYGERAACGVGLVITEAVYVHKSGQHRSKQIGLENDQRIQGLTKLADVIRDNGAVPGIQISHAGGQTSEAITGYPPLGPSQLELKGYENLQEINKEQIDEIIKSFKDATRRAEQAGFKAIEIHGAHGYLLTSFVSPLFNQRSDEYGGSLENRMRLPLEIVRAAKEELNDESFLCYRITADDFLEGGLELREAILFAKELVKAGVDLLHVSVGAGMKGYPESISNALAPMYLPPGHLVSYAEAVKKEVDCPVVAVCRLDTPDIAEKTLQRNQADLVAIGRGVIADPEWPIKAKKDKDDDIRYCLACMECHASLRAEKPVVCTQNARVGKETVYPLRVVPSPQPKRVVVVGGGPGGMECARRAALQGHEVFLFEKEQQLGGQALLASVPPGKENVSRVPRYLEKSIKDLNINIFLNSSPTRDQIKELNADTLVVATGAQPTMLNIHGLDKINAYTAWDVLKGNGRLGKKIVVIGGGYVGAETASCVASSENEVIIVEMRDSLALDMEALSRYYLLKMLDEKGVKFLLESMVTKIGDNGVHVVSNDNKEQVIREVDTLIMATGSKSNNEVLSELRIPGLQTFILGDSVIPRKMVNAISEAYEIAEQI